MPPDNIPNPQTSQQDQTIILLREIKDILLTMSINFSSAMIDIKTIADAARQINQS